jgi:beta-mannosidase
MGAENVNVPALTSEWLTVLDFDDCDIYGNYFSFGLFDKNGAEVSAGSVLFCRPKHFRFKSPNLKAAADGDSITITADAYAKSIEIDCPDSDMLLSDNYFDLNGGQKTVKILRGKAGTLRLRSVYDIR